MPYYIDKEELDNQTPKSVLLARTEMLYLNSKLWLTNADDTCVNAAQIGEKIQSIS